MDAANRRLYQMAQTSRLWHKWSSWLQIYLFKHRTEKHCRLPCTFRILIGLPARANFWFVLAAFFSVTFTLVSSVPRLAVTALLESTGTVSNELVKTKAVNASENIYKKNYYFSSLLILDKDGRGRRYRSLRTRPILFDLSLTEWAIRRLLTQFFFSVCQKPSSEPIWFLIWEQQFQH